MRAATRKTEGLLCLRRAVLQQPTTKIPPTSSRTYRKQYPYGFRPSFRTRTVNSYGNAASILFSTYDHHRTFSSLATTTTPPIDSIITPPPNTKTIPFLLADIGEGIAEVELLQWFVTPGDIVAQFDQICEVQSDKATTDITSRYDGMVLSVNGSVGDMIKVGEPLVHIAVADEGGGGGDGSDEMPAQQPKKTLNNVDDEEDRLRIPSVASTFPDFPRPTVGTNEIEEDDGDGFKSTMATAGGSTSSNKVLATPAVRRIGMENNIDLSTIMGTGPHGRVLKADVLKLLNQTDRFAQEKKQDKEGVPHPDVSSSSPPAKRTDATTTGGGADVTITPGQDTTIPIRGYNRLMVKSMTQSLQIPHMVYSDEINMNELLQTRQSLKPNAESQGIKLSFLPFAIKATSLALKQYPVLNSSLRLEEEEDYMLTYHGDHNIGVAVDTPRGLAVPVVRSCQELSVLDIAVECNRLQSLATEGNLSEIDISNPTFTLSNIGAIGGTYMSPIVTPPQVAIGAMGKIQRLPRYLNDNSDDKVVEEVHIMQISWGGDHRVVDGATMARFSNLWKGYMENPVSMMFSMK